MRADGAPGINQAISPTWTGNHTFTPGAGAAITVNAASGASGIRINGAASDAARLGLIDGNTGNEFWLLRAGGAATGVFDIFNNTTGVSAIQIGTTGAVSIINPGNAVVALTVNGNANDTAFVVASGISATGGAPDQLITRAGSTANGAQEGPNLVLKDTTNNFTAWVQASGGQMEFWSSNGTTNTQMALFATTFFLSNLNGLGAGSPTTQTASFSQSNTQNVIICNGTASITVTLLSASANPGRWTLIKTIAAQTVVSNASNVRPITSATAGTAILAATAGSWALLVSDGTDWVIMANGT
jgi:hypothetical protein